MKHLDFSLYSLEEGNVLLGELYEVYLVAILFHYQSRIGALSRMGYSFV
jgi:hypothetical protein